MSQSLFGFLGDVIFRKETNAGLEEENKMSKKFVCKSDTIFDEFIIIEALKQSILFEKPAHEILNITKNDLKRFILEMDGIVEQEQEESK
jgi:hypothetical protein